MPFDKKGRFYKLDNGERFYGSNVYMIRVYALEEILGKLLDINVGEIANNDLKAELDKAIINKESEDK